jgi:hypothetical protein
MIEKPKKERRFLKTLGKIGEILIQELLLKVGSNLIKRIGGKKTLPSILFLFLSISLFAQFPNTGNKQRLGFQTTADGLVWRGSISDTASIQPISNQNAWVILDTVNLKIYSFDFSSNVWNQLPSGTTIDTTSLSNRINLKLNIADTASMLTNYLRSGVASNTYLPLTGGTITGTINRQEGSHDNSTSTFYYNILNYFAKRDNNKGNQTAQITFTDRPGTATFSPRVRTSDIYLMTAKNLSGGQLGQYLDTTLSIVANQDGGRLGISNLNPAYKLDVNGTLGVTGATTLTGALTVNNATVLNEGSGDFDTRIESDGNANMVFVDAGLDRVGIGTNTPSKTLDVNGEVKIATVTAPPTSLLGKDGSNVVGEVTDINQSGVMKVGGITATTNAVGGIDVAHGLPYTPSKVIATIAQTNSYVIVVRGYTSTDIEFTIYDSTTGIGLDTVSVGFFWLAFK